MANFQSCLNLCDLAEVGFETTKMQCNVINIYFNKLWLLISRIQKVLKDREAYSLYIFKPEDKIRTFCQDLTSKVDLRLCWKCRVFHLI